MWCHWKVRLWDAEGNPTPYSRPATRSMGLLKPEDVKAKWIGLEGAMTYPGKDSEKPEVFACPLFRKEPKPGAYVFDLGQKFAGVARLKVRGPAETRVVLRFAEVLNPDGTIYTTNLRGARQEGMIGRRPVALPTGASHCMPGQFVVA